MKLFLADIVLIIHFIVIIFVTLNFFFIPVGYVKNWQWTKNLKIRLIHLFLVAFVMTETILGFLCPLTIIENNLRLNFHDERSFIAYWLSKIIFWEVNNIIFILIYLITFLWTCIMWKLYKPNLK